VQRSTYPRVSFEGALAFFLARMQVEKREKAEALESI